MKTEWRDTHDADFELLRHFLLRFFDSELITTPGQWVATLIRSLPFTASIFFILIPALNVKYRHAAKGGKPEWYRHILFGDELWLITLSMALIGLLAAIKWQSLFPSRLDYLVLGSLPVKAKQIFRAKLKALLWVAAGAIVAINTIPSVLFPLVSRSPWQVNASLAVHIVAHALTCTLASFFFFFALLACQGLLSNLIPRRWLAQMSSYVQGLLISVMLVQLTLSFSIGPPVEKAVLQPELARWLPPVWYLALYQKILGDPDPRFGPLALRALAGLAVAFGSALLVSFLSYYRHRRLLSEGLAPRGTEGKLAAMILDRVIPDPRQQAVLTFMLKTLARSGQHRMLMMGYCGLAVAITLSGLVGIGSLVKSDRVITASFVYAQTILLIFVLLGLRHLFAIPAELRANWTFQITEREGRTDWLRAVERFVLIAAAIPVLAIPFPLEVALMGWRAVSETILFAAVLLLCYEFLFMEWEKLPFTCSYLPGKSPGMMLLFAVAGFMGILPPLNMMMVSAVHNSLFFAILLALLAAVWVWAHKTRKMVWGQLRLTYDDTPEPEVRGLNLGTN